MNYYEHHIGDYAQATMHLTFVEDAAYGRLLRKYYAEETPIPADLKAAQRLVAARTKEEKEAVETVLSEFFELEEDGWHNKRADSEIAKYQEKQGDGDSKKKNEAERQRRHRERRKALFEELRGHGEVPRYDTPTSDLEALLETVMSQPVTRDMSHPVTRDATATQTPVPRHQQEQKQKSLVQRAARSADRFPDFWAEYPVKKGKADAEAKWRARGLDAIADRIIADVKARKQRDRQWLDGYAPHGSTYVNGRGWEDEIEQRQDKPKQANGVSPFDYAQ